MINSSQSALGRLGRHWGEAMACPWKPWNVNARSLVVSHQWAFSHQTEIFSGQLPLIHQRTLTASHQTSIINKGLLVGIQCQSPLITERSLVLCHHWSLRDHQWSVVSDESVTRCLYFSMCCQSPFSNQRSLGVNYQSSVMNQRSFVVDHHWSKRYHY